jgi:hypothetical protein
LYSATGTVHHGKHLAFQVPLKSAVSKGMKPM